ncbi:uncharacterized protein LODBEIA_P04390 [Lodderomyces beijingensis]|uniref:Actin-like protein ARP6 n=1 Tax=Lodderomyces beijingensis TaxID=1775926 RepID=A0ABP0ZGC1_9ASCO
MSKQHLIIDNGAYNIKAGFNQGTDSSPHKIFNAITRTKDGLIHFGNQFKSHTNNFSGIQIKRPFEQGHLTSWETEKPIWDYTFDEISSPTKEVDPSEIHLTLTETPYQLPQLSSNTDQIVFEEYGFSEYYRCTAPSLVPFSVDPAEVSPDFTLVIDAGFNSTWIMPMLYQKVHWEGVRKLPIGGSLINGLLKEVISFRHYDISADPILINTIKESTCFLATDFNEALKKKAQLGCQFVLPDFKTTTTGYVVGPDTPPLPADTQLLTLYDERFTVPESFYHPEIIFDSNGSTASNSTLQAAPFKNLTDLVVSSIMSCPEVTRPLLSANIVLVGGTTNILNFKNRLLSELRRELPSNWRVQVHEKQNGISQDERSWYGGVSLTNQDIIREITVSKKEYFEHGSNWCQNQFGFKNL